MQRVTKALFSASQAGRFRVPDLHGAMFKIYRRETAAPELDFLPPTPPQCLSTEASLTRKACLCTNELFRATHNTVTVLDASIHWLSLPSARAEPCWKTEARAWTSLHLSDLSDRGIPKASRIVANVLTPSGDLSAGITRRQLFHFLELTIEIEL
jgi:hypothetical protein